MTSASKFKAKPEARAETEFQGGGGVDVVFVPSQVLGVKQEHVAFPRQGDF